MANKTILLRTTGYNDGRSLCYFDQNKRLISSYGYPSGYAEHRLTIPEGCTYVGVTRNVSDRDAGLFHFEFVNILSALRQIEISSIYELKKSLEPTSCISMFESVGCCGDSYTRGQIYNSSGASLGYFPKSTWAANMEKLFGITANVYAKGGATTESYLTDPDCLPKALAAEPEQLYILALGINDRSYVTRGTINDITDDYENNPNTFYGNYGKIIEKLKEHAPSAKFVIVKSLIPVKIDGEASSYYNYSSKACEEIAAHYGFPYIETINNSFLRSEAYINHRYGGHPTAPLYAGLGKALGEMIGKAILENIEYFNDFLTN